MLNTAESYRCLRDDVLIRHVPSTKFMIPESSLIIKEDSNANGTYQFFEVIKVGPEVPPDIAVGLHVMVKWTNITNPFELLVDGKTAKCGITTYSRIDAIIEE